MKKFSILILFFLFSTKVFCQNISFDDVKTEYENLIIWSNLETLRKFCTSLDLYSQSPEFKALKKHSDYKTAFLEVRKVSKILLESFENPWDEAEGEKTYYFSTKLIDEKFYYLVLCQNKYITQRMIFYRVLIFVSSSFLIFLTIIILLLWNQKKEKQKNLIFTQAMLSGQESERKRISEELHDSIAQNLKAQKFLILNTTAKFKDGLDINSDLEEILEKSKSNILEIRSICQNLFPPDFENQKLDWIIAELCENVKKQSGISCSFMVDPDSVFTRLSQDNKLNFFRIIQEAVNNAVTHSKCSEIQIYITKKELVISDNGNGFDYQIELQNKPDHFGLRSIKERAALLDGLLEISSSEKGTIVKLKLR